MGNKEMFIWNTMKTRKIRVSAVKDFSIVQRVYGDFEVWAYGQFGGAIIVFGPNSSQACSEFIDNVT